MGDEPTCILCNGSGSVHEGADDQWHALPCPNCYEQCPECGGAGWVVGSETICCGRSDWECGGRGCSGPEQGQVQEGCEYCRGEGVLPRSPDQTPLSMKAEGRR